MEWFYSKTTGLYVSLEPLKIGTNVFKAAKELGISLNWDDNGFVINLTLHEAKLMAKKLGGMLLSPSEYWQVHKDAETEKREDVIAALESKDYTEFLDRAYISEDEYIDHPVVNEDYSVSGNIIKYKEIVGRPGWIYRDEIDTKTGHPFLVHEKTKDDRLLKYWSPDLNASLHHICFPIRGYVTSVASISLDLGIPIDSRQPKLMMRLCTDKTPDKTDDSEAEIAKELKIIEDGARIVKNPETILNLSKKLSFSDFATYIKSGKKMLEEALKEDKEVILTMGHRNPDSDTVVSSMLESFRHHLLNEDVEKVYLPMIQSKVMPLEIRKILGDEISDAVLFEADVPIDRLIETGRFHVIYTDQNYQEDYQRFLIAVTDHHEKSARISPNAVKIPSYIEKVGSTASIIATKFLGCDFWPDAGLCRIFYSAMLMDTELRVPHKMTAWDEAIMDLFKSLSETQDDASLYGKIMEKLLSEEDLSILFSRDYKTFAGFGFAVLKVHATSDIEKNAENMQVLTKLADKENQKHHFLFTLLKLAYYCDGAGEVEAEKLICVFRPGVEKEKKSAVLSLLKTEILHVFPHATLECMEESIAIKNVGKQISRKAIAPLMEQLVTALEKYCYVPFLDKYVCRDFLKLSDLSEDISKGLHADSKGRVCEITFDEVKDLLDVAGLETLSLKEYWQVLDFAVSTGDVSLYESMMSAEFLEYLDTLCLDGRLIHHPIKTDSGYAGKEYKANVLPAEPGLILVDEIDRNSGLPSVIHSPAEYSNKLMWRYWSPKNRGTFVFSRSFIFLIGQKCLDAKMHTKESCANLGIRPVKRSVILPAFSVYVEENELKIEILN